MSMHDSLAPGLWCGCVGVAVLGSSSATREEEMLLRAVPPSMYHLDCTPLLTAGLGLFFQFGHGRSLPQPTSIGGPARSPLTCSFGSSSRAARFARASGLDERIMDECM